MAYVCRVSGGAGSVIAAHRTVEAFGARNCVLVFADTGSEHDTTYDMLRFMFNRAMPEVASSWLKKHDGDIWDFFDQHGMIRGQKSGCMASHYLKQKVLDEFHDSMPGNHVTVTGLDWMEEDRIARLDRRLTPRSTYYPLCYGHRLSRCQLIAECESMGYPKQALYERGYPHNNCGKHGCVLAGISQWVGFYNDDQDGFLYSAERERLFQIKHDTDFTVLKDRRNGTTAPLSLYDLRDRIETNDVDGLQEFRSTCGCATWQQGDLFEPEREPTP